MQRSAANLGRPGPASPKLLAAAVRTSLRAARVKARVTARVTARIWPRPVSLPRRRLAECVGIRALLPPPPALPPFIRCRDPPLRGPHTLTGQASTPPISPSASPARVSAAHAACSAARAGVAPRCRPGGAGCLSRVRLRGVVTRSGLRGGGAATDAQGRRHPAAAGQRSKAGRGHDLKGSLLLQVGERVNLTTGSTILRNNQFNRTIGTGREFQNTASHAKRDPESNHQLFIIQPPDSEEGLGGEELEQRLGPRRARSRQEPSSGGGASPGLARGVGPPGLVLADVHRAGLRPSILGRVRRLGQRRRVVVHDLPGAVGLAPHVREARIHRLAVVLGACHEGVEAGVEVRVVAVLLDVVGGDGAVGQLLEEVHEVLLGRLAVADELGRHGGEEGEVLRRVERGNLLVILLFEGIVPRLEILLQR